MILQLVKLKIWSIKINRKANSDEKFYDRVLINAVGSEIQKYGKINTICNYNLTIM